jgi:hypothetical protein
MKEQMDCKQAWVHSLNRYPAFLASGLAIALFALATIPALAMQVHVRDGQTVRLKLRNILTTDNVRKGDAIEFDVAEDIIINGHVVIAKGAIARGMVIEVKGAQKPKAKDAEVKFQILTVESVDHQNLPLRVEATKTRKTKASANEVSEKSPIPGYPSRLIGAEKGKEYVAYVDGAAAVNAPDTVAVAVQPAVEVPVTPSPVAPAVTPAVAVAPTPQTPSTMAQEPSSVKFSSTPDGAEIVIDGTFVGNTPSTLRVTPGRHAIEIRIAGYRTWSRSMIVDPESTPSVQATLSRE